MNDTKSKTAGASIMRGASLMMLFKLSERSIGFVSTLILARVLTPADFGLVAMAMSVVALMELMGAFGFDVAIIQKQNTERKHFDTAWTFNLIFSCLTAVFLLILTIPAADFYNEPRLHLMIPALAFGALIQGFENVGTVMFRKDMDFAKEFRFLLSKKVASFAVTITLALVFRSYWALIAGIVFGKTFSVVISYLVHPFRPRLSLAASHEFFHFSKWLFLSNLVLFIQNKADNFVLGRTVGAHDLGLYNIASEIAAMPSTELIAPINRAVFPAYAMLSTDLAALRTKFLEVFSVIALIAFPVSVGLVCVADTAVRTLLGPQWVMAVPLLQMFAVCGFASSIQSNMIIVIVALGQPRANTLMSAGMLVVYLPAMIYASINYGTMGAASVHMVMSMVVLIPLHIVFFRITGVRSRDYFGALLRPALAVLAMAAALYGLSGLVSTALGVPPLLVLLVQVVVGGLVYAACLLGLWWLAGRPKVSAETDILRKVGQRVPRMNALIL